jgi:hypothetical protein
MFFSKRTEQQKSFYESLKKVSNEINVKIHIWLTLYGFLKRQINENIIEKINIYYKINEDMKDIIYFFITAKLDTRKIMKYNFNILNEDFLFKGVMQQALLCRNINNISLMKKAGEKIQMTYEQIDENHGISFFQMMSKIYSLTKKEYNDDENKKFESVFKEYDYLLSNFLDDAYSGVKKSGYEVIHKRAESSINELSECELFSFNSALMVTMLKNNK